MNRRISWFRFIPILVLLLFNQTGFNRLYASEGSGNQTEMVLIKGAAFPMGDSSNCNQLVSQVTVGDFWMAKHEVTVGEFNAFIRDTGYITVVEKLAGGVNGYASILAFGYDEKNGYFTNINGLSWRNPGFKQADNHPVVCISWYDTLKYCNWRSKKEGRQEVYRIDESTQDLKNQNEFVHYRWTVSMDSTANGYRLPTEVEWEYAARSGGKNYRYAWGSADKPEVQGRRFANVADETGKQVFKNWVIFEGYHDGYIYTAPVGRFAPNGLGLHDMTGNVAEWCWDWFGIYQYEKGGSVSGPSQGGYRVNRSGGWDSRPVNCPVAKRNFYNPDVWFNTLGFRLVIGG